MLRRSISGIVIGALSGAILGATSWGIYDYVHSLNVGLTSRWSFAALGGFISHGALGGITGLFVGATNISKIYGAFIGLVCGLSLALLIYIKSNGPDRSSLDDILILTVLDLSLVGLTVSTFTGRFFANRE